MSSFDPVSSSGNQPVQSKFPTPKYCFGTHSCVAPLYEVVGVTDNWRVEVKGDVPAILLRCTSGSSVVVGGDISDSSGTAVLTIEPPSGVGDWFEYTLNASSPSAPSLSLRLYVKKVKTTAAYVVCEMTEQ